MSSSARRVFGLCILTTFLFTSSVNGEQLYSPYVDKSYPTDVYWGDTHLHTNESVDVSPEARTPETAYLFARGGEVTASNGVPFKLQRPLDFLVIADHAENLGLKLAIVEKDNLLMKTPEGRALYRTYEEAKGRSDEKNLQGFFRSILSKYGFEKKLEDGDSLLESAWNKVGETADKYNDPGKFTAFIGYEWTSWGTTSWMKVTAGQVTNLHRVVIFKDDAEIAGKIRPFSSLDSSDPEDLWEFLESYESSTGGEVLAIPHNGNLTFGGMFATDTLTGKPVDQDYSRRRNRWEPLFEVTQNKGDSETHPFLSPTDEFADYETWTVALKPLNTRRKYEYARSALKLGLNQQAKLGVNPFKFGMIGSSDAHGGLSAVAENNYAGKAEFMEPSPGRSRKVWVTETDDYREIPNWRMNAAGYAAVWAEENTRESLFAAMKRKEVYASTGPRVRLRFFGGWDYSDDNAFSPDLARIGYEGGVPMGGDLTEAPKGKAPKFLIRAVKDPDGANLDRVQVIKGWRSKNGELHEKVYDVALSDGRKIRSNKRSKPVGSTVDIEDASYINTIGDPELAVVWEDPDFDTEELAFYYVRVIEIPTPRWTAYDAKFFNVPRNEIPKEIPMVIQERVYSSPIWYSPR